MFELIKENDSVVRVEAYGKTIGDLSILNNYPALKRVELAGSYIHNSAFDEVLRHSTVEVLNLNCCHNVTNACIRRICKFTSLRNLQLMNTEIDDGALDSMLLLSLEHLRIDGTRMSPEGVRRVLEALPIKDLWLGTEQFTLELTDRMRQLVRLYLVEVSLGSPEVKELSELPLQSLALVRCKLSDETLLALDVGNMKRVTVHECSGVSWKGFEAFELRNPGVSMEFGEARGQ